MRSNLHDIGCVAVAVLAALSFFGSAHAIEAGAAKVEITPRVGTPLNGYIERHGRDSLDVHDPLWARCLYLDDGETAVFVVSADLCIINPALRRRVLEIAGKRLGVLPQQVVLCATHTHSGHGGMMHLLAHRAVSGRFIPEVLEETATTFVEAMQGAYLKRQRAAVGFKTVHGADLVRNRYEEKGTVDGQLCVIRVDDADGIPIAIAANFAAHPS
ncbi:MAG TPA: hypothetical protein ENN80_08925, partial [Candidatus Hydrogenedentes bacterium]|nr:hypothetical protein [Candidatus Hydrogenedentota bacterium]